MTLAPYAYAYGYLSGAVAEFLAGNRTKEELAYALDRARELSGEHDSTRPVEPEKP